jgi:hypothetical protein
MSNQRKCFIVNLNDQVELDVLVTDWGKPEILTTGYIKLHNLDFLFTRVWPKIVKASPDDFLVMSGNSAVCSVIALIWYKYHGICHMLVRDQKRSGEVSYYPVTLPPGDWASNDGFQSVRNGDVTLNPDG